MTIDLSFAAVGPEIGKLYATMEIHSEWTSSIDADARSILNAKARLQLGERLTTVHWVMIGLAVLRECGKHRDGSLRFDLHPHNGDPLTDRTTHVPKHRPGKGSPPFTWEASLVDAMDYDGLNRVGEWSIPRIGYEAERFNGEGYREFGRVDPYLWSGTLYYRRGKYDEDGHYDPDLVDKECGVMPVLKRLIELDPSITFGPASPPALPHLIDAAISHPTATKAALTGVVALAGAVPVGWSQVLPYAGLGLGALGAGVLGLALYDLWQRHQHLTSLRAA